MEATKTPEKCKKCGKDLKEDDYVFMGFCEQCFEKYEKEKLEKSNKQDSIPYNIATIEPQYLKNEEKGYTDNKMKEKKKVKGEAEISYVSCIFWVILAVSTVILFLNINIFPLNMLCMVPAIGMAINQFLYVNNMSLYYTDKRVVGKVGTISIKTLDTPINKINNIYVSNSILGFGTIRISSSSGECIFRYVNNADELKNGIMEEIEKYEQNKIKQQAMELAKAIKQTK